jgi:two-component system sensor histidine kinase KdpD
VGKTFSMLEEGHAQRAKGRDVVIGLVETHGRVDTAARIGGLEIVPRRRVAYRDRAFEEMDVDAVLARRPELVLVDELAHTNVPGSRHAKRWEDVEILLDAGIDVLTTLNIQHLESLNDVVFEITGVLQRETIPDAVVRRADEIELVDLPQEGIRDRLAAGKIYPPERVDAALANYFRPGNLSALRELALSWTADRVEEALTAYRGSQGIVEPWETRERVVVGIAGIPGGEAVIRRAARMAMRARGELHGVHVRPTDGLSGDDAALQEHRALLENLGGTFHEVVGDDVGQSLLAFARSENATQIVLGATSRSRFEEITRGMPLMEVIRGSGPIDVHVISHSSARPPARRRLRASSLGRRRQLLAWLGASATLPVATFVMEAYQEHLGLENVLLIYATITGLVAILGGAVPAVATAIVSFLLANWYFVQPHRTLTISSASDLVSLLVFLGVAINVGLLMGNSARRAADARRARAQAEALVAVSSLVAGTEQDPIGAIVRRVRDAFGLEAAAVLVNRAGAWETLAAAGETGVDLARATDVIEVNESTILALLGSRLTAEDRSVLHAFAGNVGRVLERIALEAEAGTAEGLAETDRLRTALLGAVSHDLRTPLASIMASVTSLLETEIDWTPQQTRAFLVAILEDTERLNRLVGQLLDASRVQVGAVHVFYRSVGLDEVVDGAIGASASARERILVDVPETLPDVQTDPALLERVVSNLVENALAWSPVGESVTVSAGVVGGRVDLRIMDRGPGIPPADRERIFQPFQRLGDRSRGTGVGLGLAVARGFLDAMGHELTVEDTPGGGTTMVIGLKVALTPAPASIAGDRR